MASTCSFPQGCFQQFHSKLLEINTDTAVFSHITNAYFSTFSPDCLPCRMLLILLPVLVARSVQYKTSGYKNIHLTKK